MIRIYLDWNIISSLKKPEFQEIKKFIEKHKQYLQFPYSPAHFTDLMKSYNPDNEHFDTDLEALEYLCGKHHIRWEENVVKPLFGRPKEFFEGIKDNEDPIDSLDMETIFNDLDESLEDIGMGKMGTMMKSLYELQPSGIEITEENKDILKKMFPNLKENSSMWDLMKDIGPFSQKLLKDGKYYKDFRKSLSEQGFKLEANSGNWNYDKVVKNIDDFLAQLGTKMTFLEYVETALKHKKEKITQYEFYTTAYLMLDMLGYKTDKLPKPTDNMQNIQADGEHSFYGGHCDYFVAIDKKLRIKSKVLYNEFNINTKILEPNELIAELESVIDPLTNDINFIQEAIDFCNKENLVESYPDEEGNGVESFAFKLPRFYFNFFNYVIYTNYPEQDGFVLNFRKAYKNFSRFVYYTESENIVDTVCDYFGYENLEELTNKKKEFVFNDKAITFDWNFEGGLIRLENEEDTNRPTLSYIISTKEKKSD
jgi:hypothetical protein